MLFCLALLYTTSSNAIAAKTTQQVRREIVRLTYLSVNIGETC